MSVHVRRNTQLAQDYSINEVSRSVDVGKHPLSGWLKQVTEQHSVEMACKMFDVHGLAITHIGAGGP
ncbi:MAG: hypothetical protein MH219_14120 [Marinobacter sp.]|jgi:transposase-like protein|nr:hypothetical protein [Marinobacter sp.]